MEEQGRPEDVQPAGMVARGPAAGDTLGVAGEAPDRPRTHVVYAGVTDVGRQRKHNEDCVLLRAEHGLFCVADGMGGHNAGDVASKLVTTSLGNYFDATAQAGDAHESSDDYATLPPAARRLVAGVSKANRDVFTISSTHQQHHGMGSTVVAIHLSEGMVHVAHVGDSRCYRIREGEITQLTRDHSLINDALDMKPDLTKEELARLPKNIITRALGMKDVVKVDIKSEPVLPGDAFLLCSDGLTGMVPVPQILDVINLAGEPQEACELLIAEANDHGGNDNISAILVRIEEGDAAARPAQRRAPAHADLAPDSGSDEDELARVGELVTEGEVELSPESGRVAARPEPKPVIAAPAVPPAPVSRPALAVPPPPPVPRIPSQPPVPAPRPSSQQAVPAPRPSSQQAVPAPRPSSQQSVPMGPQAAPNPGPASLAPVPVPRPSSQQSVPMGPQAAPNPGPASLAPVPVPRPSSQQSVPAPAPAAVSAPAPAAVSAPAPAAVSAPPPAPSPPVLALVPEPEPAVVRARVLEIVPDPDEDFPPLPPEAPDLEVGAESTGALEALISEEEAAALEAGGEIDLEVRGDWTDRAAVARCARCRHELFPGNLFCVECGARIEAAPDGVAGEP